MKTTIVLFIVTWFFFTSCNEYLDVKPDKSIGTPTTLKDLEYLLQNSSTLMNNYSVGLGELTSDDIYFSDTNWKILTSESRNFYTFIRDYPIISQWSGGYNQIMYANTVLDYLDKVTDVADNLKLRNELEGRAYFHRAYAFFELLQVFAKAYNQQTAFKDLGVVLRLTSDNQVKSVRSSIQQCYDQILLDLHNAEELLSSRSMHPTVPDKAALYGLLSRVYLQLREVEIAGAYAEKALDIDSELIDYNMISPADPIPFKIYNEEVIFHICMNGGNFLVPSRFRVHQDLINLYDEHDLRKKIFYTQDQDSLYMFKGNYYGNSATSIFFCGITVPELILIQAEGLISQGNLSVSADLINKLRRSRYTPTDFQPISFKNLSEASAFILEERRRELAFRGIRWKDLRRLAFDENKDIQVSRTIEGKDHILSKLALLNFTYWIPELVINTTGMPQN